MARKFTWFDVTPSPDVPNECQFFGNRQGLMLAEHFVLPDGQHFWQVFTRPLLGFHHAEGKAASATEARQQIVETIRQQIEEIRCATPV